MLIGPRSTREEQAKFRALIEAHPDGYIASLPGPFVLPTFVEQALRLGTSICGPSF